MSSFLSERHRHREADEKRPEVLQEAAQNLNKLEKMYEFYIVMMMPEEQINLHSFLGIESQINKEFGLDFCYFASEPSCQSLRDSESTF